MITILRLIIEGKNAVPTRDLGRVTTSPATRASALAQLLNNEHALLILSRLEENAERLAVARS